MKIYISSAVLVVLIVTAGIFSGVIDLQKLRNYRLKIIELLVSIVCAGVFAWWLVR